MQLNCPNCNDAGPHGVHSAAAQRYMCKACGRTFRARAAQAAAVAKPADGNKFVVTCAVSGSPVHSAFLKSLQQYCRENGARLIVVPVAYRNPTSNLEKPHEWFAPELARYMSADRLELCPGVLLLADVPTQPTAVRPLSGLHTMSGDSHGIFAHPKIALESVPVAIGRSAKLVMTTGAVTEPVYSKSKAGKKGEFHQVQGAVVVEWDGQAAHFRHFNAGKDGSFCDIDLKYSASNAKRASHRAKVLTLGDLHGVRHDPVVLEATIFADDSMVNTLQPETIVLHDVLDFQSASHHNDYFERFKLRRAGNDDVYGELCATADLLERIAATGAEVVLAGSNHNEHIYRWIEDHKNGQDVQNAIVYHETKLEMLKALAAGGELDPLEYWVRKLLPDSSNIRFLRRDESFIVDGVEYGQHGDKGINGARGSLHGMTKAGAKLVIGHSHTPGIADGVYQVGTSSQLQMGYNTGLSGWRHTHCVQYASGKRSLVHIVNGKWRAAA